jgi:TonB-linked SusC/RagA family outer membrane protein
MKKIVELGNSRGRNRMLKLLLIMKITAFFLLAFAMQITANVYSQKAKLQVDFRQASVKDVISEIEKQTGFTFFYSSDVLNTNQTISLSGRNISLDEVLSEFCQQTGLKVEAVRKQILVKQDDKPTGTLSNTQQSKTVRGKVTNPQGEPIPGATVTIKGTTIGTTTDTDGAYTLTNVSPDASLQFSFIGMKTQTIELKGRSVINVILEEESIGLDEIVAVGYGAQKKISIIGSVSTIEPRKLITSNANLSSSLAGQLAGVLAVQRSGEPGRDQSDFWIRGVSTFNANSQKAMVLVDGVERDLNNVDPLDIESFSILKDATATAVYGVRGANGVILINTKKGKTGEPRIQVQVEQSLNAPVKLPEYIDGATYMEIYNEACRNSGVIEKFSQARIDKTRSGEDPDLYPNVDWLDEVFQDFARNEKVNLNVSGGTDKIRYYMSGAYLHENGILKTDEMEDSKSKLKFDRFNFRSNVDIDLSKTTLFKLNLGGYYKEKGQPGYGVSEIFFATLAATPISYPKIYSDGSYAHLGGTQMNPWMASTHSGYSMNTENQIESTIALEQKLDFLAKGLSAKGLFSFDAYNNQLTVLRKHPTTYYAMGRDADGKLILKPEEGSDYVSLTDESNTSSRSTYIEAQINYVRTFNDVHNVSGLILYNQSGAKYTPAYSEVGSLPYRTNGIAGRLTYNYADRYFIEGNFGYNGSENFAPEINTDFSHQ